MKQNSNQGAERARATAFDDFENEVARREMHLRSWRGILRAMSGIAFCLALASALVVLALDSFHFLAPDFLPWRLKSAFPLMFIGISYGCLQFTLLRSAKEFALSMAVSVAFILWGVEQFVQDAAVALLIDDVVMFLFVLDLGVVIRGHLKQKSV